MSGLAGLEIFLGYPCNQKCIFCFQKDLRSKYNKFLDSIEVKKIIDKGCLEGKKSIIFSGGESTIDKNLLDYIKYCKQKGFNDIRVHTNGLYFSDNEKLLRFYNAGMSGVILSIHGYGKVHDVLVGFDGAFEKVKRTLLNLTKLKAVDNNFVFDTNTVLARHNYNNLHVLFKFLSYFPITRSQIVQLYSLYLFSKEEKNKLFITYKEFNKYLDKIIKFNSNVTLENFPLCEVEKKYWKNIIMREKYDNDAYGNMGEGLEESDCIYIEKCNNCEYKSDCTGIPKDYLEVYPNK